EVGARGVVERLGDGDDAAVRDADVRAPRAVGGDDGAAADREVQRAHRSRASASTRRRATSIATATSAAVTASAGLWLTPPAQRTKSIATSQIRAMTAASWPAPLGRRATGTPAPSTALSSARVRPGEHATAAVTC